MRFLSLDLKRHYPYRGRTERLIAAARALLALASLFAVLVDPTDPSRFRTAAYTLVAAYVAYAFALLFVAWRVRRPLPGIQVATHATDLIAFVSIMYFTEGSTSLFFVYFVFALVVATLRWETLGTLATAFAALLGYVGLAVVSWRIAGDEAFELNRFVLRVAYLAVLAILLTQFDRHGKIIRDELESLARWRRAPAPNIPTLLRAALPEAMAILGAKRGLLVWEEAEEASRFVAYSRSADVEVTRHPPDSFGTIVAPALARHGFIGIHRPHRIVLSPGKATRYLAGDEVDRDLLAAFSITDFVTVPLYGPEISGRLFALEPAITATDSLAVAEIIGSELLAGMEEIKLQGELQRAAAFEERARTAADLHDGLLQSLTAAGLQLATLSTMIGPEQADAKARLLAVQDLVAEERRDLRQLIDEMRPGPGLANRRFDLSVRLAELREQLHDQWGLQVRLNTDATALASCVAAGDQFARQVYYLAHEGLTNVARHAQATAADLTLSSADHRLHLSIQDDGQGFPVTGRYDLDGLEEKGIGPVALGQRVRNLRGTFFLASDRTGSRIDIELPLLEA